MNLLDTITVTPIASALINLFKLGWPSAPSWALALVSLIAGIGGAFVASLAQGQSLTTQLAAQDVIVGVLVAVAASGLDRLSVAAQSKRDAAAP